MASPEIEKLIRLFGRLPGLGPRSSQRAVLALLKRRATLLAPLLQALEETARSARTCSVCGNIDTADPCALCRDPRRDGRSLLVVEAVEDLWAMERAGSFRGRYHVLGGTLSATDRVGPEELGVDRLLARVAGAEIEEVILALSATVDGQTTAHYLAERLRPLKVPVTRLGHGVPVGGELNYLDEGTLAAALRSRQPVS